MSDPVEDHPPAALRLATPADGTACSEIYATYVTTTAISFELIPPSPEEMAQRIAATLPDHPWLVSVRDATIVGYAYAHQFALRPAYRWSVETSIYIGTDERGRGVGRPLYTALLRFLGHQGFVSAFAGITQPNVASVRLHEALGYRPAGRFERVGWKMGSWHDVGWWRCDLTGADPTGAPGPTLSPGAISTDQLGGLLSRPEERTPRRRPTG